MNIVITCGGTGGHIYPALAIAAELSGHAITFVGTDDRLERTLIPAHGYRFVTIQSSRKNVFRIITGIFQALILLRKLGPDCIVSTGGYVTFPVCLAAVILRKKIILQEQNTIPGKVNRWIGRFATRIALGLPVHRFSFPASKATVTGTPIRPEFFSDGDSNIFLGQLTIPAGNKVVLILGGSQGARSLNIVVTSLIKNGNTPPSLTFILITGEKLYSETRNEVTSIISEGTHETTDFCQVQLDNGSSAVLIAYTTAVMSLMKRADLIVARSGASTLAEISAVGKPSVLVPYPYAADNHQYWNARYFSDSGASILLMNEELSAESLAAIMTSVLSEPRRLSEMSERARSLFVPNSAALIAQMITT